MAPQAILNLFKKDEPLLYMDIGASGIRILESTLVDDYIEVSKFAYSSFEEDVFKNNIIVKPENVAEKIKELLQSEKIFSNNIVTAVPGSSAFSKKISLPKMDKLEDLDSNIRFESNSLIPHGLDGVYFDYALLKSPEKNENVFITAVKKDIVESIQNTLSLANLNLKILDIDYLALLNLFEFSYPELFSKTIALVDIGGRYSTINICSEGEMSFSANIPMGGRLIAEDLSNSLKIKISESDFCDIKSFSSSSDLLEESLKIQIEKIAGDLKKQLEYYWESGTSNSIEKIFITGGGANWENINQIFSNKFNTDCETFNPLKKVKIDETLDEKNIQLRSQQMSVLLGLSLRKVGDSKKRYGFK